MLVQIQLVRLLVGSLVVKLSPSFCFVWYDLPTNNLTNDPTNNRTNWIWTSKKIGLNSVQNSLICPKNKSASHCLTKLFPIYPNNHWTIGRENFLQFELETQQNRKRKLKGRPWQTWPSKKGIFHTLSKLETTINKSTSTLMRASMASKVRTPQQPKTDSYHLEYHNSEKEA